MPDETNKPAEPKADLSAQLVAADKKIAALEKKLKTSENKVKKLEGKGSKFKSWDAAIAHYMKAEKMSYPAAYAHCDKNHSDLV